MVRTFGRAVLNGSKPNGVLREHASIFVNRSYHSTYQHMAYYSNGETGRNKVLHLQLRTPTWCFKADSG